MTKRRQPTATPPRRRNQALRHLHSQVHDRRPGAGLQLAGCPARSLRAVHPMPSGLGWQLIPEEYSDGGFTGANIERPAFQRLMQDVEAGKIDVVVVYKVDRLSRSLLDFAKVMDRFNRAGAAFVSVTQNFSTADAMGRLTLEHADELRRVRARDDRRAHARQDVCGPPEGEVDGRSRAARLRRGRSQAGRERSRGRPRAPHLRTSTWTCARPSPLPARSTPKAGQPSTTCRPRGNSHGARAWDRRRCCTSFATPSPPG